MKFIKLSQPERTKHERTKAAIGGWRIRALLRTTAAALFSLFPLVAFAQYTAPYVGITGTFGSANGMPASNYGITLEPTQVMYVGGTSVVVANANCGTDVNGTVVGTLNPVTPPVVSPAYSSGSVPIGNYYVEVTWYDAFNHQTLPSPEVQVQLTTAGSIVVSPPVAGAPLSAVGMDVYIGTSSGAETYQGQVTNPAGTYTQATAITTGAALPTFNATVCVVVANDAAWPIAGYMFNLTTPAGNNVPGFPQQVQFVGPGSAFNVSNGLPAFNGRVTYPVPILSLPYNHNAQSISGPLSMSGYNLYNVGAVGVGTAVPAYGVDVEGSGVQAAINANQGYLVNGGGGGAGQCLGSDGTYYDVAIACITTLPTAYYQTVLNGSTTGSAVTQRGYLAVGSGTGLAAVDTLGVGSQVSRTVLDVNAYPTSSTIATDPYVVMTATGGSAGQFACWDATTGGLSGSSSPCSGGTGVDEYFSISGCSLSASTDNQCSGTFNLPTAMPDASYQVFTQANNFGGTQNVFMTISQSSLPVTPSTTVDYVLTCTFGCTATVSPTVYVHAHHN